MTAFTREFAESQNVNTSLDEAESINKYDENTLRVYRKRYIINTALGRRYTTFIKVIPGPRDLAAINRGRLRTAQIQTAEKFSLSRAFNFQLNRVEDRWNVAIKRTSGFFVIDTVWRALKGAAIAARGFGRLALGTTVSFSDLLEGAEFQSRSIEKQRETETMVFASLAAIMKAVRFAGDENAEVVYLDDEFMREVKGLIFAGGMAGTFFDPDNTADESKSTMGDDNPDEDLGDIDFESEDMDADIMMEI